jgi:hypothetical protein
MKKNTRANQVSDKDAAAELAGRIRRILDASMDMQRAPFNELFSSSKGIQRRVLELLKPPTMPRGRPKKLITDEDWLAGVEWYREHHQVSEREAIRIWLTDTNTRWSREGPFRPETPEGKKEVRRIQDACIRARRTARSK